MIREDCAIDSIVARRGWPTDFFNSLSQKVTLALAVATVASWNAGAVGVARETVFKVFRSAPTMACDTALQDQVPYHVAERIAHRQLQIEC